MNKFDRWGDVAEDLHLERKYAKSLKNEYHKVLASKPMNDEESIICSSTHVVGAHRDDETGAIWVLLAGRNGMSTIHKDSLVKALNPSVLLDFYEQRLRFI